MRRRISTVLLFCLAGLLAVSLVSPYIRPVHIINPNFAGLAFPIILGITGLGLLLFFKRVPMWLTVLTLGLCVYGSIQMGHYIQFSIPKTDTKGLNIMSYNTMMGQRMVNKKHVLTKETILYLQDHIHGKNPVDILCAQEVNSIVDRAIQANKYFEYRHTVKGTSTVIYSRYPIIKSGKLEMNTRINGCVWADIAVDQDTIRVYSAHLQSNRLTMETYHMLTDDKEYEREKAIRGVKDVLSKYHRYTSIRAKQAEILRESVSQSPYPAIVCGDFNDPPMSYTYHTLGRVMEDAYLTHGSGIGSTWNGYLPFLRIDYILYSKGIECIDFERVRIPQSDHYPIRASFDLK